jgi:uncharacterized membrane protein
MLVAFPIGLWVFALVCDILRLAGGSPAWNTVALCAIGGGIVGAFLAAVPGFIDYLSIDEAEMKRIATTHLLLGLGSVVIFGFNFWLRFRLEEGSKIPLFLSIAGVLVIGFGGWLGGEMVYVKGMAVEAVGRGGRIADRPGSWRTDDGFFRKIVLGLRRADAGD